MRPEIRTPLLMTLLLACACGRPAILPMDKAPARGQKLVVLRPMVEGFSSRDTPTVTAALTGSILSHLGSSGQSYRVGWTQLESDFENIHTHVFQAAYLAWQKNTRDIADTEIPDRDSMLFRELDSLGNRLAAAYKMLHLPVWTPTHFLVTGIHRHAPDFVSNRHFSVFAFVVDRDKKRLAFGIRLELTTGDNLFRQVDALLKAGKTVAKSLLPWFPQELPPVVKVTVPAAGPRKVETDPKSETGDSSEEE